MSKFSDSTPTEKFKILKFFLLLNNIEKIETAEEIIEYFNNIEETLKLKFVKFDYRTIQYLKDPSEEIQLAAIEKNTDSFRLIRNPTKSVKIKLIEKFFEVLKSEYKTFDYVSYSSDGSSVILSF
jgi:hypothetical protein